MEDYFSEILPTVSPGRTQRSRIDKGDNESTFNKEKLDGNSTFNIAGIFKILRYMNIILLRRISITFTHVLAVWYCSDAWHYI